jgi:hypothetical protein
VPRRLEELVRAVEWRGDHIAVIDQTLLPQELVIVELRTVADVVDAIGRLVVRGAPAIGVCGAFGVALGLAAAGDDAGDPTLEEVAEVTGDGVLVEPPLTKFRDELIRRRKGTREIRRIEPRGGEYLGQEEYEDEGAGQAAGRVQPMLERPQQLPGRSGHPM